jgi:hypothetical protein
VDGWENFFIAEAGASAALAGLAFVSISINLQKIVISKSLPSRAVEALGLLLVVLILSSLMLVPGQSITFIGAEALLVGVGAWILVVTCAIKTLPDLKPEWTGAFITRVVMGQCATLAFVVAGIVIFIQGEGNSGGLYWIVPGFILCFVLAFLDAWVLLVEINR